jgi:hypothetical protein
VKGNTRGRRPVPEEKRGTRAREASADLHGMLTGTGVGGVPGGERRGGAERRGGSGAKRWRGGGGGTERRDERPRWRREVRAAAGKRVESGGGAEIGGTDGEVTLEP